MVLSSRNTVVELNGHTVVGLSDDSDAIMFPNEVEIATVKTGIAGDKVFFDASELGGEFAIKLLPNSPSIPFFSQQASLQIHENTEVIWNGSVQNNVMGISFSLKDGVMVKAPFGQTHGKSDFANQVFTFHFSSIEWDYGSAKFGIVDLESAANQGRNLAENIARNVVP